MKLIRIGAFLLWAAVSSCVVPEPIGDPYVVFVGGTVTQAGVPFPDARIRMFADDGGNCPAPIDPPGTPIVHDTTDARGEFGHVVNLWVENGDTTRACVRVEILEPVDTSVSTPELRFLPAGSVLDTVRVEIDLPR